VDSAALADLRRRTAWADVPNRLVAYLLDAVALGLVVFLAAAVLSVLVGPSVEFEPAADRLAGIVDVDTGRALLDTGAGALLSAAWFAGSWVLWGATPGQRLLRLRVRRARDGGPVPAGRALVRWLLIGGPSVVAGFATAGPALLAVGIWLLVALWFVVLAISVARSDRGQGLHDAAAGTDVVKLAGVESPTGTGRRGEMPEQRRRTTEEQHTSHG
jgi:uncharacterized RDD family membrane protein YckC